MKNKNHNIRFNMEKEDECRAWELLHSPKVRQMFKSQNKFVIEAVNDYYDRCVAKGNDPYLVLSSTLGAPDLSYIRQIK